MVVRGALRDTINDLEVQKLYKDADRTPPTTDLVDALSDLQIKGGVISGVLRDKIQSKIGGTVEANIHFSIRIDPATKRAEVSIILDQKESRFGGNEIVNSSGKLAYIRGLLPYVIDRITQRKVKGLNITANGIELVIVPASPAVPDSATETSSTS